MSERERNNPEAEQLKAHALGQIRSVLGGASSVDWAIQRAGATPVPDSPVAQTGERHDTGLPAPPPRDGCQVCEGHRGGVPGNEQWVNGVLVCDYCEYTVSRFRRLAGVAAPDGELRAIIEAIQRARENLMATDDMDPDVYRLERAAKMLRLLTPTDRGTPQSDCRHPAPGVCAQYVTRPAPVPVPDSPVAQTGPRKGTVMYDFNEAVRLVMDTVGISADEREERRKRALAALMPNFGVAAPDGELRERIAELTEHAEAIRRIAVAQRTSGDVWWPTVFAHAGVMIQDLAALLTPTDRGTPQSGQEEA